VNQRWKICQRNLKYIRRNDWKDQFGQLVGIKEPMEEKMTQWKHKMASKKMIMCLWKMMNLGYMILLISLKMPLKKMLNFANF
jgi:hypothetical protein